MYQRVEPRKPTRFIIGLLLVIISLIVIFMAVLLVASLIEKNGNSQYQNKTTDDKLSANNFFLKWSASPSSSTPPPPPPPPFSFLNLILATNNSNMTKKKGVDDNIYGPFDLSTVGFTLFNITFTQLFIQTNGYVTLRSDDKEIIFLRVFDSDVDIRHGGEIWHGQISSSEFLDLIATYVDTACYNYWKQYVPSWAYIITWYQVRPYFVYNGDAEFGAKSEFENTFQIVLTTAGPHQQQQQRSFAIYTYERLDWPNKLVDPSFHTGYTLDFDHGRVEPIEVVFENRTVDSLLTYSNCARPGIRVIGFDKPECA